MGDGGSSGQARHLLLQEIRLTTPHVSVGMKTYWKLTRSSLPAAAMMMVAVGQLLCDGVDAAERVRIGRPDDRPGNGTGWVVRRCHVCLRSERAAAAPQPLVRRSLTAPVCTQCGSKPRSSYLCSATLRLCGAGHQLTAQHARVVPTATAHACRTNVQACSHNNTRCSWPQHSKLRKPTCRHAACIKECR